MADFPIIAKMEIDGYEVVLRIIGILYRSKEQEGFVKQEYEEPPDVSPFMPIPTGHYLPPRGETVLDINAVSIYSNFAYHMTLFRDSEFVIAGEFTSTGSLNRDDIKRQVQELCRFLR